MAGIQWDTCNHQLKKLSKQKSKKKNIFFNKEALKLIEDFERIALLLEPLDGCWQRGAELLNAFQ